MLIRSRKIQVTHNNNNNNNKQGQSTPPKKVEPNFMKPNFNTSFRPTRPRSTSAAGGKGKVILHSRSNSASVLHRKRPRRPWIPPPGKAAKAVQRDKKSYPLCLVCDQLSKQRNDLLGPEYLTSGSKARELCDEADKRRAEARRMKVMRDLWEMDGGDPGMKLRKWKHILNGQDDDEDEDEDTKRVEMASGFREFRKKSPERRRHIVQIHRDDLDLDLEDVDGERSSRRRHRKKNKKKSKLPSSSTSDDNKNLTESIAEGSRKVEKAVLSIGSKSKIGDKQEELMKCLQEIEQKDENIVVVEQGQNNTSEDVSVTFSAKKTGGEDFFAEVIIDELKRENAQLKQKLTGREAQLAKAAHNIKATLEENARLARKLEKALGRASQHAENFGEEMIENEAKNKKKIEKLQRRIEAMEKEEADRTRMTMDESGKIIRVLKDQLEESEERNKNLRDYIEGLKQSYLSVFDSKE